MKGLILVDHGSRRDEANNMMQCMANLVQTMAGPSVIVRMAHMELADPTVAEAFEACVAAGATEIVIFPYMLSPGRHSTSDIPRMVTEASKAFPGVSFSVTPAFGVHEKLGEIILGRAGLPVAASLAGEDGDRCWDPACTGSLCGDACRARNPAAVSSPSASPRPDQAPHAPGAGVRPE